MNSYNIYLEIRNPKKQAMDMKLEAMACYLTNQRLKSKGTDHGAPPGRQWLGLGFDTRLCGREHDDTMVEAVNCGTGAG